MKKLLLVVAILAVSGLSADYLEVKTGEGKAGVIITSIPKLFVCYTKRVKFVTADTIYLRYDGCARYLHSCKSNGKARFGKYPSINSAKRALHRCRVANPKFID